MSQSTGDAAGPVLRVVRGDASPEELAALVVVLARRAAGPAEVAATPPSLWSAPQLRAPQHAGPGAWWASGLR